jgi:hypothetical protein
MREALRILQAVPVDTLNSSDQTARENLLRTFVKKKLAPLEVPDPFVARLIEIYRDYWMRVLLGELNAAQGKDLLFKRLTVLLEETGNRTRFQGLGQVSDELARMLRRKGFYSTHLITQPYYDLMIWRKETVKTYRVKLPETTIKTKVVFMDDFATLGWSAFATCGTAFTGGWVGNRSLNCVGARDPMSDGFAVDFLAHEAQHFADKKRFPKLEQPELEYRAKLVQLILSKDARNPLTVFALQTGQSRSAPHNYANLRVFTDVSRSLFGGDSPVFEPERWTGISAQDISRVATPLLERNTKCLVARGARRVSRVLEEPMP